MKGKKQITDEQKKLDVDLWIIALATLVAYFSHSVKIAVFLYGPVCLQHP